MKHDQITIAGETFATKRALEQRVRGILHAAPPSGALSASGLHLDGPSLAPAEFRFMLDLLTRHPNAETKIGPGVSFIYVVRMAHYDGVGFAVVRVDGSYTDFSYKSCITPPTLEQQIRKACRSAIAKEIVEFKTRAFATPEIVCPLSGRAIGFKTSHVDHAPPWTFDVIFKEFLAAYVAECGGAPELAASTDGSVVTRFADPAVSEAFVLWHRERAQLRVVFWHANLSLRRDAT